MLILDKPHPFTSETISIPLYHRGHLSLFYGAKVWLCLLPAQQERQFSEIVISPINNESWSDLWRISMTLRDRVGLVHDVFAILAEKSINIITAESSTTDNQILHSIELIVNAQAYKGTYEDSTYDVRSTGKLEELKDLRREILARLTNDIAFLPTGRPRLRIRRVRHLLNARHSYNQVLSAIVREAYVEKVADHRVTITLPEEIKKNLLEVLGVSQISRNKPGGHYLMISNTGERFLSIFFMRKSDNLIAPTIEHQDEIGALAAITDALGKAGFNILTSLSRLYRWESQARTEFVLQPPTEFESASLDEIKTKLETALTTRRLVKKYKLQIGYPEKYAMPIKGMKKLFLPRPRKASQAMTDAEPPTESGSIGFILNNRSRELAQRLQRVDASIEDSLRHKLVEELIAEQATVAKVKESGLRHSLFISYNFNDETLKDRAGQEAESQQFNVFTARAELSGAQTTRHGIITLINRCTHFLGIWTEKGGHKVKGRYLPSPWLYWEWGVANALGKRWHLLISDGIHNDAWQRIAGETPHSIYSRNNFETMLKSALESLTKMG